MPSTQFLLWSGPGPMRSLLGVSQSPVLAYYPGVPVSPRDLAGTTIILLLLLDPFPILLSVKLELA